jgi:putative transposase
VDDRRHAIALFRYSLVREAADPALSTRQRGALVRQLAERDHLGPDGARVRISRNTLDRWIRAWRAGGFQALLPADRSTAQLRSPLELLELAADLKREAPMRTSAQIAEVLRTAHPGQPRVPSPATIRRYFHRIGLHLGAEERPQVFGRFQAAAPNLLWTGDALHGPTVDGRKSYLFGFSTTTPACWSATAGALPRTPCAWRPRCGRAWPPVVCPPRCMSTTAARSPASSWSGPARCWASA